MEETMTEAKIRECTECGFEYYGRRERCNQCYEVELLSEKPLPRPIRWLPTPIDAMAMLAVDMILLTVVVPVLQALQWIVERARRLA